MLKRYDPITRFDQGGTALGEMKECADGDYVKHEDVCALLAGPHEPALLAELKKDAETFAIAAREIDHALTWFQMSGEARAILTALHNGIEKRCEPVREVVSKATAQPLSK